MCLLLCPTTCPHHHQLVHGVCGHVFPAPTTCPPTPTRNPVHLVRMSLNEQISGCNEDLAFVQRLDSLCERGQLISFGDICGLTLCTRMSSSLGQCWGIRDLALHNLGAITNVCEQHLLEEFRGSCCCGCFWYILTVGVVQFKLHGGDMHTDALQVFRSDAAGKRDKYLLNQLKCLLVVFSN